MDDYEIITDITEFVREIRNRFTRFSPNNVDTLAQVINMSNGLNSLFAAMKARYKELMKKISARIMRKLVINNAAASIIAAQARASARTSAMASAPGSFQTQYLEYDSDDLEELMGITFSDTE